MPKLIRWTLLALLCATLASVAARADPTDEGLELRRAGRLVEAEPHLREALLQAEARHGPKHPDVATASANLAGLLLALGRHAEAEALFIDSLAIREAALGRDHVDVAQSLDGLAVLYRQQGRYDDAEPLYRRAIEIKRNALGPDSPSLGTSLSNLAALLFAQGRLADAEPLLLDALAIQERALGPVHVELAPTLNNLAALRRNQGRYSESAILHARTLKIREAALGPEHPGLATTLNNLAVLRFTLGQYAEAAPLLRRALAIRERALGHAHPAVAVTINNLVQAYRALGRQADAEAALRRALAIQEEALGAEHPEFASTLNNLAAVLMERGDLDTAEGLLARVLANREKALGPEHRDVASALHNLAEVYAGQGRRDDARALLERVIATKERLLGAEHIEIALSLVELASLHHLQGSHAEARPLFERALRIQAKALGPDHPTLAQTLGAISLIEAAEGRSQEALRLMRRASAIMRRAVLAAAGGDERAALDSARFAFTFHVLAVWRAHADSPDAALAGEALEAAQLAAMTDTATAAARAAARFASGDDDLSGLVREWQDLSARERLLDTAELELVAQDPARRDPALERQLQEAMAEVQARLASLRVDLDARFPAYTELVSPAPASVADLQAQLGATEALVVYLLIGSGEATEQLFVWLVARDRVGMWMVELPRGRLAADVAQLRKTLDPGQGGGMRAMFDLALAHSLYRDVLPMPPSELDGIEHLLVVPDGPLTSLPFSVLLRTAAGPSTELRDASWLARHVALTTLPSVSALRGARRSVQPSRAVEAFRGVGDPLLDGHPAAGQSAVASLDPARGLGRVAAIRGLPPLPESADELRALATALGADETSLLLRERATERAVRTGDLGKARVIAFATHAIVAGDLAGLVEPALVLTPPAVVSEEDDGMLAASEAAQLRLDADIVVLSACNTAAADGTPGALGLSGLAKAFLYAGARSLLASHWAVYSEAATRLTTGMFAELSREPGLGHSEALRRAMLELVDSGHPLLSHPSYWAPFVVVGEGGALSPPRAP